MQVGQRARSGQCHFDDARTQRPHALGLPRGGAFGMQQHAITFERGALRVGFAAPAGHVRDQAIGEPEALDERGGVDDLGRGPVRHQGRGEMRDLLIEHPVGHELGVVRAEECGSPGIHRSPQAGKVGRGELEPAQPEHVRQDHVLIERPEQADEPRGGRWVAIDQRVESRPARGGPRSGRHARASGLYLIRCGWSASVPKRS